MATHYSILGERPGGSDGKESDCNSGDLGSIPGLGRSPGEGHDHPLQYSGLENFIDCIVHGVTKSQTGLSNFHYNPHWPQLYSIDSSSFKDVGILNYFRWFIASLNKIEDLSITETSHRH